MASSNTNFRICELDFDGIKENLKTFLRSQNQFADYDFEGSGMNVILDLLAYNTHYLGYYMNMIANESTLESAVLRDSIVSRAKQIGYTPTSRRAAVANVSLTVTAPGGNTQSTATIPQYFAFQTEAIDGVNYTFVTKDSFSATKNVTTGQFIFPAVNIYQGEQAAYNFTVDASNPQTRYIIPEANIDTSTLSVTVLQAFDSTTIDTFTQARDLTTLDASSKVYFLEAAPSGEYALYFGDGYLGKQLSNGNIILTQYVATSGMNSNKANTFTPMTSVGGFSNVVVTSNAPAAGGADEESSAQIKFRAPIAYTSQNRAVTLDDYNSILLDDYPNVEQISVWGGDENDPVIYGKVFISMKPKDGYVLTTSESNRIINEIISNRSIITVTPEIVAPVYLYLLLNSKVYYDQSRTTLSKSDIETMVRTAILEYTDTELGKFNTPFRNSRIHALIDNQESSIESNEINITIQKRFSPTMNVSKNYEINFGTPLRRGGAADKLVAFPSFTTVDAGGTTRTTYMEETPFSYTGIDVIEVTNPGNGYTEIPTVTITGDGTGATATATIINGRVSTITIVNRGSDYSLAVVTITEGNGSGATALAILSMRNGLLRTFYYNTNGDKIVLNDEAGIIEYDTGKINLYNFRPTSLTLNPFYASGVIVLNTESESENIVPVRNNILTVDSSDPISVLVEAIAD